MCVSYSPTIPQKLRDHLIRCLTGLENDGHDKCTIHTQAATETVSSESIMISPCKYAVCVYVHSCWWIVYRVGMCYLYCYVAIIIIINKQKASLYYIATGNDGCSSLPINSGQKQGPVWRTVYCTSVIDWLITILGKRIHSNCLIWWLNAFLHYCSDWSWY